MFNTFPTQSSQEDSGSTFSSGLEPKLKVSYLPDYYSSGQFRSLEGYASLPRSSILMPANGADDFICQSSNGSTIYQKTNPNAVISGYDEWVGFWMNEVGTLLYIVMFDRGTTPYTYALVTVDAAGTVTTLGTDQPSSDFAVEREFTTGTGMIPQDDGGFKLISDKEYAVIDSAGQFTTQPTDIFTGVDPILWGGEADHIYMSDEGYLTGGITSNLIGGPSSAVGYVELMFGSGNSLVQTIIKVENVRGFNNTASSSLKAGLIPWKDYIVVFRPSTNPYRSEIVKYSREDFDKYLSELAQYTGVTL